jgi:hypothetical protein
MEKLDKIKEEYDTIKKIEYHSETIKKLEVIMKKLFIFNKDDNDSDDYGINLSSDDSA